MIPPLRSTRLAAVLVLGAAACGGGDGSTNPTGSQSLQDLITLPEGFTIDVWAADVIRPRSLALGDDGTVYVGTYFFTKGVTSPVYAIRDTDGDHRADQVTNIRGPFNTPNGIAYHDGTLFIVDEDRVFRIDDIEQNLASPSPQLIYDGLPSRAETDQATNVGHWWRYLEYGPDDHLYITVGTRWSFLVGAHTANDLNDDPVYSTIVRLAPDGSTIEVYADGVRNSMGLAFHPVSGDLWFTDNGPSWPFEDPRFYDIPPDELNRVTAPGAHFGFPYEHGRLGDPLIGADTPADAVEPRHEFAAHSAPLGIEFYTGTMFPAEYRNRLFVAEHGTEATTPAPLNKLHGDRIGVFTIDDDGNVTDYQVFADGFRQGSNANYTRRPVDLLVLPDGSMLISDDQAQTIYRISYQ